MDVTTEEETLEQLPIQDLAPDTMEKSEIVFPSLTLGYGVHKVRSVHNKGSMSS